MDIFPPSEATELQSLADSFDAATPTLGIRPALHSSPPAEAAVARACLALSGVVEDDLDMTARGSMLVRHLRDLVGPLDVSVAVMDVDGGLEVVGCARDRIRVLQELEVELNEGPTIDVVRSGKTIANIALDNTEHHWARYAPMARGVGYAAVHAFPLRSTDGLLGAVVVAGGDASPLSDSQQELATLLCTSASIGFRYQRALAQFVRLTTQLEGALASRVVVEQAKGVVAERLHVTPADAFTFLRTFAQRHGLAIRTVARGAIDGELQAADLLPARPHPYTFDARPKNPA